MNTYRHQILEATTDDEIKACYPVVRELRPHIPDENELLRQVRIQRENEGFHLMYIKDTIEGETEPRPVSIMSWRIMHCLFYGRQLYVNDLCTISSAKKKGYAGTLMDWVIDLAKKENCDVATLDSGYTRNDAHRLYMNKGFYTKAHHFALDLNKKN